MNFQDAVNYEMRRIVQEMNRPVWGEMNEEERLYYPDAIDTTATLDRETSERHSASSSSSPLSLPPVRRTLEAKAKRRSL